MLGTSVNSLDIYADRVSSKVLIPKESPENGGF